MRFLVLALLLTSCASTPASPTAAPAEVRESPVQETSAAPKTGPRAMPANDSGPIDVTIEWKHSITNAPAPASVGKP